MIITMPAAQLQEGDVLSTDGYALTTVVLLPKTKRVFVQAVLDGHMKTATLAEDAGVPVWFEDSSLEALAIKAEEQVRFAVSETRREHILRRASTLWLNVPELQQ